MAQTKNYFSTTRIACIAIFGALSGILYSFGFSISVAFPSFLELNFADIPTLIGTFALGPVSGAFILIVKIFLKLVIKGTSTVFVGEVADLLIGLAFVLPAGFIYKKKRMLKGAFLSLGVGTLTSTACAVLANWLIIVPFYVKLFFGGSWDALVGLMTPLFPSCNKENFYDFYLWVSVLPFNLMRCFIATAVTLLVYKHVSRAINRVSEKLEPKPKEGEVRSKKGAFITLAVCLILFALLVLFALLRYFFW